MIRVESLHKRFGDLRAVDGVTFEVRAGEIYGLLGPNGAGKTTTLSMVAGLLRPDSGRIAFDGVDQASEPMEVKRRLGVVPQDIALYEELSARENVRFWGALYGLAGRELRDAVDRVLEAVGLTGRADDRVKGFSGGMKRRLNLALGLVHRPRAVLLDEPTVGIDPQARLNVLDVVRGLAAEGTAVLYTTHYLEEAESLCDRIGILDHGKLLAEGTVEELTRRLGGTELVTVRGSFDPEEARRRFDGESGVRLVGAETGRLVLSAPDGGEAVRLLARILDAGLQLEGVTIQPPSLSGVFLELTGRELRD